MPSAKKELDKPRLVAACVAAALVQYMLLSLFLFALVQPSVYQAAIVPPPVPVPPPAPLPPRDAFSCRQCDVLRVADGMASIFSCLACNNSYAAAAEAADVEPVPPHPSPDFFSNAVLETYFQNHTWLVPQAEANCTAWDASHCATPFRPQSPLLAWVLTVDYVSVHPVCAWCVLMSCINVGALVVYIQTALAAEKERVRELVTLSIIQASNTRATHEDDQAPPPIDSIFDSASLFGARQRLIAQS